MRLIAILRAVIERYRNADCQQPQGKRPLTSNPVEREFDFGFLPPSKGGQGGMDFGLGVNCVNQASR